MSIKNQLRSSKMLSLLTFEGVMGSLRTWLLGDDVTRRIGRKERLATGSLRTDFIFVKLSSLDGVLLCSATLN